MLKQIGAGAGFLVAITVTGAFLAARATPEPSANLSLPPPAASKPFAPVCKANEITDSRPDPAWVGASFSGDNCTAPRMPAAVDGFTASREKVVASMAAMKRYSAASDAFQRCVHDFVAARRDDKSKKPMSVSLVIIENHRVIASENSKKKVVAQVRATINAFNEYGSECPG